MADEEAKLLAELKYLTSKRRACVSVSLTIVLNSETRVFSKYRNTFFSWLSVCWAILGDFDFERLNLELTKHNVSVSHHRNPGQSGALLYPWLIISINRGSEWSQTLFHFVSRYCVSCGNTEQCKHPPQFEDGSSHAQLVGIPFPVLV